MSQNKQTIGQILLAAKMIDEIQTEMNELLVCPRCHCGLQPLKGFLRCAACERQYPVIDGIADFVGGRYYDNFTPGQELPRAHEEGLAQEARGTEARIMEFYLPWIRRLFGSRDVRVLDTGCGNGLSVDLLTDAGFDAWGNDSSSLRKYQWRMRRWRNRLVVADSTTLPFPAHFFDVILGSGVIEHVGVAETGVPTYAVTALPTKDDQRRAFLRELLRVLKPGGRLLLDFPNGAFPIDFWHATVGGGMRWHSLDEGFLPTFAEVKKLLREQEGWSVIAHSPYGRLRFRQVGAHWYGRWLRFPVAFSLWLMTVRPFRWLARTGLNPFLILEVKAAPR